jgi:serine/threonine protein kinase
MPQVGMPRATIGRRFLDTLLGKELRRDVQKKLNQFSAQQSNRTLSTINGAPLSPRDIKQVPAHVFLSNSIEGPEGQFFSGTPGLSGPTSLGGPVGDPAAPPPSRERDTVKDVLGRLQKIVPSAGRAAKKAVKFIFALGFGGAGGALIYAAIPFFPFAAVGWLAVGGACLLTTLGLAISALRNNSAKNKTLTDFKILLRDQAKREILADELNVNKHLKNPVLGFLSPNGKRTFTGLILNIENAWHLIGKYERGDRSMTVEDVNNLLSNFSSDNLENLSFYAKISEIKSALVPQPVALSTPAAPGFSPTPTPTPPGGPPTPPPRRTTPPGGFDARTPTPSSAFTREDHQANSICEKTYAQNDPRSLRNAYEHARLLAELVFQHDKLTPQTLSKASDRLTELRETIIPNMEHSFGLRLTAKAVDPDSGSEIEKNYVIELAQRKNTGMQIPWGKVVAGGDKGAMGEVYLAKDTESGETVAIKVIKASGADASPIALPELRMRLEFRALQLIRHPNIMEVHAFGSTANGRPFIAMEYIDGPTLDKIIRDHKNNGTRIGPGTAVKWAGQVLRGLQAAHVKETAHRDIKAANVFRKSVRVSPSQRSDVIVVGDFGLARSMADNVESSLRDITKAAAVLGTLSYIAPEFPLTTKLIQDRILSGQEESLWLFRNDIYAVGVLLYELLTLEKPFSISGQDDFYSYAAFSFLTRAHEKRIRPEEINSLIEHDKAKSASRFALAPRDIPADLFNVIAKMLAYNPKDRTQSCKEAMQALDEGLRKYQESMVDRSHMPTDPYAKTASAPVTELAGGGEPPTVGRPAARPLLTGTKDEIIADLEAIFFEQKDDITGKPIIEIKPGEEMAWVGKVSSIKVDGTDQELKDLIGDTIRVLLEQSKS